MTGSRPPAGAGFSPRHGADDLEQFRRRLEQLRAAERPPTVQGEFEAFTDGACLRNPDGAGGWGAVIGRPGLDGHVDELWGHLTSTSNNRAEALAVLAALEWVPPGSTLHLRSDSELTVKILDGAYRARANADIWSEIRRVRSDKQIKVLPTWVRGHVGHEWNERADRLAVLGAVNGDTARAARLRQPGVPRPALAAKRSPTLPPELEGLQPRGAWEASFLASVARQLRAGRALSEKQGAIVERIRARERA